MSNNLNFKLINTDHIRACLIETAHGKIETPVFMPVGTLGTVSNALKRCRCYWITNNIW